MNDKQSEDGLFWFRKHLEVPFRSVTKKVRGCDIQYAIWGDEGKPGMVLVHGGLAHLHWWRFLAPFWSESYRIVAFDLSGHGDSAWRKGYDAALWAEEIAAAIEVGNLSPKPFVLGHSLGGLLGLTAAAQFPDLFGGLIIIDSPVLNFEQSKGEGKRGNSYLHILPYPNLEIAKQRFRLVPPQPVGNPAIFEFLAEKSLKKVEAGWIWKFDPSVFVGIKRPKWLELFEHVTCPMAYVRGEHSSIATNEVKQRLQETLGKRLAMVDIPNAHHHLMLGQPLALVASINALLAAWKSHST